MTRFVTHAATAAVVLLTSLGSRAAFGLCVTTPSGYRECFRSLDSEAVAQISAFDPVLAGLRFAPPNRIDVRAEFGAFAARTAEDRASRSFDASWAAGVAVTASLRSQTLDAYSELVIDQIRVDLGRAERSNEVERPFFARIRWTRAKTGRSGSTWVHGRVRQIRSTGLISLDDESILQQDLNARLAERLKIDLLVGDRGLASSEAARRRLVRHVLFPAVVGHGLAAHLGRAYKDYFIGRR